MSVCLSVCLSVRQQNKLAPFLYRHFLDKTAKSHGRDLVAGLVLGCCLFTTSLPHTSGDRFFDAQSSIWIRLQVENPEKTRRFANSVGSRFRHQVQSFVRLLFFNLPPLFKASTLFNFLAVKAFRPLPVSGNLI